LETGSGRFAEASYRYALSVEVGLYAGSFDPVHLGHMALIAAAAEMLDRMVVVVAANPQKQTAMFSVQKRVEMLSGACQPFGNVRVVAHEGLVIDIAAQVGATVLVRSAGKEHVDEEQMAYLNGCEGLRTFLIPSDPATAFISSSQVRALIGVGALDAVAELVPPGVTDRAKARENTSLFR
jgi:pantetheine-phosphate adenylyltransferase